jgi:hypothetical protein
MDVKNHGKPMENPWKNRKPMENPWKNGKPMENHGFILDYTGNHEVMTSNHHGCAEQMLGKTI